MNALIGQGTPLAYVDFLGRLYMGQTATVRTDMTSRHFELNKVTRSVLSSSIAYQNISSDRSNQHGKHVGAASDYNPTTVPQLPTSGSQTTSSYLHLRYHSWSACFETSVKRPLQSVWNYIPTKPRSSTTYHNASPANNPNMLPSVPCPLKYSHTKRGRNILVPNLPSIVPVKQS